MHRSPRLLVVCALLAAASAGSVRATNPLITDQFTADPTARVFEGKIYVYPSHDIVAPPGKGRPGWFCMEDYHVFSSANLTDWTDHGVILRQTDVPWVDSSTSSMWAPDCVAKDGRYYFFFPAVAKTGGFRIGVAIADHPAGPVQPQANPIEGVRGIDPCVFIDRDGSAYLYYSMRRIFVAKLKDNLLELATPPQAFDQLPAKGLIEGPFVFERNGLYYLTYPHVETKTERLEYAIGRSPLGPFTPAGVILDEAASGCWTVHQSIVEYKGQWYLFYHDQDLSPDFDKTRSIRADRLEFNADGTIKPVVPTLRGVGVVSATSRIQIDRYSAAGPGVAVSFLDRQHPREGWKVELSRPNAWVRFGDVDFGQGGLAKIEMRARATEGATIEIRSGDEHGPVLARVTAGDKPDWDTVTADVTTNPSGVRDLTVTQAGGGRIEIDWIRFH